MKITYGTHLSRHKASRGGVIPYTILNGQIYFLLARHAQSGDLGDFGGGIKKIEYALNGSIREYQEETNGIFSERITPNDFLDKLAIVDGDKMAIIFAPIDKIWLTKAQDAFMKSKTNGCKKSSDEVSELVWVNEETFSKLVYSPLNEYRSKRKDKMWKLVKNFFLKLERVDVITNALKDMNQRPMAMVF